MTADTSWQSSDVRFAEGSSIDESQLLGLYEAVGWLAYTTGERRAELGQAICSSSFMVTAWQEDKLVGLARCLSDDSSIFYLQDILVDPHFQRQGIGRQLFEACMKRYAHVRTKVLMTDDEERQHRFYEAMGFTNTKQLRSATLNVFIQIDGVE